MLGAAVHQRIEVVNHSFVVNRGFVTDVKLFQLWKKIEPPLSFADSKAGVQFP